LILKVTVRTPKRQAESCMRTQLNAMLGLSTKRKLLKQELVSEQEFYWIIDIPDKDYPQVIKNANKGELIIKKFYSMLFKAIHRLNQLQGKFNKGAVWLKRMLLKRLTKDVKNDKNSEGMAAEINKMTDEELGTFIEINDRESMQQLLAGRLIEVTAYDGEIPKQDG